MSVRTIDVAYDHLKGRKHSVSFKELWQVVREQLGFDEKQSQKKISQFYTDLTLDGRFIALDNNEWDLKSNHKFDEVFIDTAELVDDELEMNDDKDDY